MDCVILKKNQLNLEINAKSLRGNDAKSSGPETCDAFRENGSH